MTKEDLHYLLQKARQNVLFFGEFDEEQLDVYSDEIISIYEQEY